MYKHLFFIIGLSSMAISAQNDSITKSVIRLSENDLNSIIVRIVEAKQKKLSLQNTIASQQAIKDSVTLNLGVTSLNREIDSLETVLKTLNSKNKITSAPANNNVYLKQNLDVLQYKIDDMKKLLDKQEKEKASKITSSVKPTVKTVPIAISNNKDHEAYKQMLQAQLDSLYKQLSKSQTAAAQTDGYLENLNRIKEKLNALQKELDLSKTAASNYLLLLKKYGSFKTQLYFENNATTIAENQSDSLNNLVAILKEHDNIDVLLKGFASKKGSAIYNQNLSMRRAESVKQVLISKGIHPTRILSMYYGIDYKANTEHEARRVDITLVVRK